MAAIETTVSESDIFSSFALCHSGARVYGWLQVAAIETAVPETDIFACSMCDFNISTLGHMEIPTGHLSMSSTWLTRKAWKSTTSSFCYGFRPTRTKSTSCQEIGEKEAKIHFPAIDAEVAVLTRGQAVSTGVKVEGPLNGGHYRYYMTWAEF